jgi:hypothetical protein
MLGLVETCGQPHSLGTLWAGYALRDRLEQKACGQTPFFHGALRVGFALS